MAGAPFVNGLVKPLNLSPILQPVPISRLEPSPRTSLVLASASPRTRLNMALKAVYVVATSPRASPRPNPLAPRLEDLAVDQLLARCAEAGDGAMAQLYHENDFWLNYYRHNFSSDDSAVLKACADDGGRIDYRAAVLQLDRRLGASAGLATALAAGADRYILRKKLWHNEIGQSRTMLRAAISSGSIHCVMLFRDYPFEREHLEWAREAGGLELYNFLHEILRRGGYLPQRYDNVQILGEICLVRDDIFGWNTAINRNWAAIYPLAVQAGAVRILRKLLFLYSHGSNEVLADPRPPLLALALAQKPVALEICQLVASYCPERPLRDLDLTPYPLVVLEWLDVHECIEYVLDYSTWINTMDLPRLLWLLPRYPPCGLIPILQTILFDYPAVRCRAILQVLPLAALLACQKEILLPGTVAALRKSNISLYLQRLEEPI